MKNVMKNTLVLALSLGLLLPITSHASGGNSGPGGRGGHGSDDAPGDDHGGSSQAASLVIVRGSIAALASDSITVGDQAFVINGSTQFEGLNDQVVDATAFHVGDFVKVKGAIQLDSSIIATEVDLENEDGHDSDHSSNGSGNSGNSSSRQVRLHCTFPNIELVKSAFKQEILRVYDAASVQVRSVKVNAKAVRQTPDSSESGIQVLDGVTVLLNAGVLSVDGSVALQSCSGNLNLKVRVNKTDGTSQELQATLPIDGVISSRDKGRGSSH